MRFDDPTNPATWLLVSFLALTLGASFAWFAVRKRMADASFRRGPLAAVGWLALSLFYLLVPFAALRRGVLSPYALGLTEINWPATLSNGMMLAGLIAGGLLFGWLVYRRALREEASLAESAALGASPRTSPPPGNLPPAIGRLLAVLRAPIDATLQQWHWAFYRAAVIGWLLIPLSFPSVPAIDRLLQALQSEPLYWGAWLGLCAAGLEWALNPFNRAGMSRSGDREVALRRAALAVATTGLFVLTRNFWLCLITHMAVETLAIGWFPLQLPAPAEAD